MATDRRYSTARWQRVRLRVLDRDRHRCRIVEGCQERATVADHIDPATPDMPDARFFDPANLRAGCQSHNKARGFAAKPRVVEPRDTAVVTGDYSWVGESGPELVSLSAGSRVVKGDLT